MKSQYYHILRSQGLVNTAAPSLRELIPSEHLFKLHCNNQFKCARGSYGKHGAVVIKNLTNPHKHKSCPKCGDPRIVIIPQRV